MPQPSRADALATTQAGGRGRAARRRTRGRRSGSRPPASSDATSSSSSARSGPAPTIVSVRSGTDVGPRRRRGSAGRTASPARAGPTAITQRGRRPLGRRARSAGRCPAGRPRRSRAWKPISSISCLRRRRQRDRSGSVGRASGATRRSTSVAERGQAAAAAPSSTSPRGRGAGARPAGRSPRAARRTACRSRSRPGRRGDRSAGGSRDRRAREAPW